MLEKEEYIEQAYFFRLLADRLKLNLPIQEIMVSMKDEILSSTKLPHAIGFLVDALNFQGQMAQAMSELSHYFTSFQTYVIARTEDDKARLDFQTALAILEREAQYRATGAPPQGIFFYQFETLCRNRLGYDRGLPAIAGDPIFDDAWREWLNYLRFQVGLLDFAELVFLRSQHFHTLRARQGLPDENLPPVLFGEKEGRIARANLHKDPLYLFASLERHLGYPSVPRPRRELDDPNFLIKMQKLVERLEARVRLLEEESRGGIDLNKLYEQRKHVIEDPTNEEHP